MSDRESLPPDDFLKTILALAKAWPLILFGPILTMMVAAGIIYFQPREAPVAFAKVMAQPQQIALLSDPAALHDLLTTEDGVPPGADTIAAVGRLKITPESQGVYKLELSDAQAERGLSVLGTLLDGLLRATIVVPDGSPSKLDLVLNKLEAALATIEGDRAERALLADALVSAIAYILSMPPPADVAPVTPGAVIVTQAPELAPGRDPRRDLLIVLLIGSVSAGALIMLVLFWSWLQSVMFRPANAETARAIRGAFHQLWQPRRK